MPLVLRAVKGSDLTPAEADGNFTFLDGRITTIEGLPVGVSIVNITMSGYTMTITMSDSSVYTVQFPQPDFTAMWAGAWQASTNYTAGQMLSAYPPSGLYGVLQDHVSATSFDAGETNTAGDVYALLLAVPAVAAYLLPPRPLRPAWLMPTHTPAAFMPRAVPSPLPPTAMSISPSTPNCIFATHRPTPAHSDLRGADRHHHQRRDRLPQPTVAPARLLR